MISMSQPESLLASRTFWPRRPMASDSCSVPTMTSSGKSSPASSILAGAAAALLLGLTPSLASAIGEGDFDEAEWAKLRERIHYVQSDAYDHDNWGALVDVLAAAEDRTRVAYLATAPNLFGPISQGLRKNGLVTDNSRIVLENCGNVDPSSIDDYLARGGYQALGTCLETLSPQRVVELVEAAGLRGRGGAGFPAAMKWSLAANEPAPKFVICNADEGDPGAFMDRSILEGDPHAVLEGDDLGNLVAKLGLGQLQQLGLGPDVASLLGPAGTVRRLGLGGPQITAQDGHFRGPGDFDFLVIVTLAAFKAFHLVFAGFRPEPAPLIGSAHQDSIFRQSDDRYGADLIIKRCIGVFVNLGDAALIGMALHLQALLEMS